MKISFYLIVGILIIISSCNKEELPPEGVNILVKNVETGELLNDFIFSCKRPEPTELFGWGPNPYSSHLIPIEKGNFLSNDVIFENDDHIKNVDIIKEGYHSLFNYKFYEPTTTNDTLTFLLKPYVSLELRLSSTEPKKYFEYRTTTLNYNKFDGEKETNFFIEDFYDRELPYFTDTVFNLKLLPNDTIRIRYGYVKRSEVIDKELQIITDHSKVYQAQIQL